MCAGTTSVESVHSRQGVGEWCCKEIVFIMGMGRIITKSIDKDCRGGHNHWGMGKRSGLYKSASLVP